jgi:hypothetical protein
MSFTQGPDLEGLRERVNSRALTEEDFALLEQLLQRAEAPAEGDTVAGRPVVARLPFGMDVIK